MWVESFGTQEDFLEVSIENSAHVGLGIISRRLVMISHLTWAKIHCFRRTGKQELIPASILWDYCRCNCGILDPSLFGWSTVKEVYLPHYTELAEWFRIDWKEMDLIFSHVTDKMILEGKEPEALQEAITVLGPVGNRLTRLRSLVFNCFNLDEKAERDSESVST